MTEYQKEIFEERAAIMEYDGGLSRKEAEKLAYEIATRETQKQPSLFTQEDQ